MLQKGMLHRYGFGHLAPMINENQPGRRAWSPETTN
jgi:hypothetical protein